MAEIVDFGLQQHKIKMDNSYFDNGLSVVAGDTGRRIEVQLLDTNGLVQDTTGLKLRLNAVVAGKATYTDATLVDATTGKYQLDLSNGMFLAPGNWQFQWLITDSAGKKLHSFAFTGNIGKNISEGGSQATNFYLNLEDLKAMQEDLVNGTIDSSILETNITEKLTNLETQYAPKLTEVTAQLAQKTPKGTFVKIDELKSVIETAAYKSSDYYALYDGLVDNFKLSKIFLGNDQSNVHAINLYVYEPTNYNKTLMIIGGLHGWEHYGSYVMYEVLKKLMNSDELPTQFEHLKNTRLLIIPCSNPWGTNQSADDIVRRGNSRGVDLNRNFDYKWETNTGNYGLSKGDAPFSEVETQYIRNVMEEYLITHFLDVHSFGNSTNETRDYLFYGNERSKKNTLQMIQWLNKTYSGLNVSHGLTENDSSANNYANQIRKIPSMNIELIKSRFGNLKEDTTRWVELLLNYLNLQSQSHFRPNYIKNSSKFLEKPFYVDTNFQQIPATWGTVNDFTTSLSVDTDGLMIVKGWIAVEVTSGEKTITISPYIEQPDYYTIRTVGNRNKPYIKVGTGVHIIPFDTMFPARRGFGEATFKIELIGEGTGTAQIRRKHLEVALISADFTEVNLNGHNKQVEW